MNATSGGYRLDRAGNGFTLTVVTDGGEDVFDIQRVALAFPQSHPEGYVSFIDAFGHEVLLLKDLAGFPDDSRALLDTVLKERYHVPAIESIESVEPVGTGSSWSVTADGVGVSLTITGREALDGRRAPTMVVTSDRGKRFAIPNYWLLDRDSRDLIREMLPDKILKSRSFGRAGLSVRGR